MKKLSIIIPCYNEQDTIELFIKEMMKVESELPLEFEYMFVNDGSKDETLDLLRQMAKSKENINYISFSRNFGKEAGLIAGLRAVTGDFITVMDVDLQDPLNYCQKCIKKLWKAMILLAPDVRIGMVSPSSVHSSQKIFIEL